MAERLIVRRSVAYATENKSLTSNKKYARVITMLMEGDNNG